jgi:hypothetical protein
VRRAFEQEDARRLWTDVPEVLAERVPRDLGERSRELDAGRSAADNHERQQTALLVGGRLAFGCLERQQDTPPDVERIVERLQARRARRPLGVSEVRVCGAGGNDQEVERDRGTFVEEHPHSGHVDVGGVGEQHRDVLLMAQHPADRRRDVARRQRGGGHLVEQRLEQMVVVAIEQRDANRCARQRARGVQAAEPAAENHDMRSHW